MTSFEITLHVLAPRAVDARDLANQIHEAVRAAERAGRTPEGVVLESTSVRHAAWTGGIAEAPR